MKKTQLLLRRGPSGVAADTAAGIVLACPGAELLHRSGDTMLASIEPDALAMLRQSLTGWTLAPQGPRIQVPDTRRKVRRPPV